MSKLRVHDMAGEFGIPSDEVMQMLRTMDVPVRSHLTVLSDDQIARVRARWEREKRSRQDKPADAPAARRRRGAKAAAAVEEAPPPQKASVRRRKAADLPPEPEPEPEPTPEPVVEAPPPQKVDVAPKAPVEAAPTPAAPVEEKPHKPKVVQRPAAPPVAAKPRTPAAASSAAPLAPSRPKPRPIVPGQPRSRPGAPGGARPIATATPEGNVGLTSRTDSKDQGRGGKRRGKRDRVDQEEVSANIRNVMSSMRGTTGGRRGGGRRPEESRAQIEAQRREEVERERKTVRVNEFITVAELAEILKIPPTQIVGFAFKNLSLMVTINQRLDFDQIELIANEFGFQAVREEDYAADLHMETIVDAPEDLESRPPIVTIMGHVDHGKTSLLDYIRKANVVAGEAGGITQHIGAYHVTLPNGKHMTFLDTPGHEAFTAMRARGAQVTDIVVLVVAANDSVMPQTIEAISHAKNAGVPMVVAVNKTDLPDANPMKVMQDLLQHDVILEEFGGSVLATPISAKTGAGVNELLEQVLLQAEILDLKANPSRAATGSVVEAQLDAGKGAVATVLVQSGVLKVGDNFICGLFSGRVRALLDERNRPVTEAGPAIPVQVLGLSGVPMAGDQFLVVDDATQAREIAQRRERLDREAKSRRTSKSAVTLEDFMSQAQAGEQKTLRILIKADQGGPAEALADALQQLSNAEVSVEVVHRGVGAITESDILLARASGAVIIGFHVRPDNNARQAAEREGVEIKLYRIIYEAVADIRAALEGLLRPEEREVVLGEAEVREVFKVSRVGTIAGCSVRSGIINKAARVRLIRDGKEVFEGTLASLRRFKDDVREVREGYECGIGIENFNDIKVGDVIECYKTEEFARTLEAQASP